MPTYGYECLGCGQQSEVFQSIKADPLTVCEDCGGTLRKRIYPVGIAFKGSGFYVNDYARKSESKSEISSDSGGDAAKSDAKSETKPETKSEPKPETKSEAKTETKGPTASTPAA